MEPPAVRVRLCPDPGGEQAFHLLLDVLAGALADDIFERARREVAGAEGADRLTLDESEFLGLEPMAGAGGGR